MTGFDVVELRFTKTALAAVLRRDYGEGDKTWVKEIVRRPAQSPGWRERGLYHCRGGGEKCSDMNVF